MRLPVIGIAMMNDSICHNFRDICRRNVHGLDLQNGSSSNLNACKKRCILMHYVVSFYLFSCPFSVKARAQTGRPINACNDSFFFDFATIVCFCYFYNQIFLTLMEIFKITNSKFPSFIFLICPE